MCNGLYITGFTASKTGLQRVIRQENVYQEIHGSMARSLIGTYESSPDSGQFRGHDETKLSQVPVGFTFNDQRFDRSGSSFRLQCLVKFSEHFVTRDWLCQKLSEYFIFDTAFNSTSPNWHSSSHIDDTTSRIGVYQLFHAKKGSQDWSAAIKYNGKKKTLDVFPR